VGGGGEGGGESHALGSGSNQHLSRRRGLATITCVFNPKRKALPMEVKAGGGGDQDRRQIKLIESNVKCRYLKKFTSKGTLRQVFYLSEPLRPPAPPPMTPYPPLTHCVRVYSILIYTGKGGERGESLPESRLEGQQFTKPVENINMTDCISSLQTPVKTALRVWCLYI
jgi:hypothetical protein